MPDMLLKFKWPPPQYFSILLHEYEWIASIWFFLDMHERRRLDELPKYVHQSPFVLIGPRNQLFYNEKHLHPHCMEF